jgi:two-component system response regulator DegU
MIKLFIADDSLVFRKAFKFGLEMHSDIMILGESAVSDEIADLCVNLQPDIVILSIPFDHQKALNAATQLQQTVPHQKIICMGLLGSNGPYKRFRDAGCATYICKTTDFGDIIDTVKNISYN